MRKYQVVDLANRFRNSPITTLFLLQKFLETEEIKRLPDAAEVTFSSYLSFLQKEVPNVTDFFTPSFLPEESIEADRLHHFLRQEQQKTSVIINTSLSYQFDTIYVIHEPAATIAIRPSDGKLITATCKFTWFGKFFADNKMVVRDANGEVSEVLVKEPASAIAFRSDGMMVTSTCVFSREGSLVDESNEIVLREPNGKRIKTLAHEGVSTIVFRDDGQMVTGICVFGMFGNLCKGEIVLRDPNAQKIKTLVEEPASAIIMLTKNMMLTASGVFDSEGRINYRYSDIVLRDANGNRIKILLRNEPLTTAVLLNNGNLATCLYDGICKDSYYYYYPYNEICVRKAELVLLNAGQPYRSKTLLDDVNHLLSERNKLACIQFHMGVVNRTADISMLCKLPVDILNEIYAYIITGVRQYEVLKRHGFPYLSEEQYKVLRPIEIIDRVVTRCSFFKQKKIEHEIKQIVMKDVIEKGVCKSDDRKKCAIM